MVEEVKEERTKSILVSVCSFAEHQDGARETAKNKNISFYNIPDELEPFLPIENDHFSGQLVTYLEAYGEQMVTDPMLVFFQTVVIRMKLAAS